MATGTINKFNNKEILEHHAKELTEYWNSLPLKFKSADKDAIKKANQLKTSQLRKIFNIYAFNNDELAISKAFHELKYEVEKELRKIASGETKEKEKKEASEGGSKKKGVVKEVPITEKGMVTEQTRANTTVKQPNPNIVRSGFGKNASDASTGVPIKPQGPAAPLSSAQKAAYDAKVKADIERRRQQGRLHFRGGNSGIRESQPVRRIPSFKSQKPPTRSPSTTAPKPTAPKKSPTQAGGQTRKPIVDPSTKTVIPAMPRTRPFIPVLPPVEYDPDVVPYEYEIESDRGANAPKDIAAPGPPSETGYAPPTVPGVAPSAPQDNSVAQDNGGGGGSRKPPKKKKKRNGLPSRMLRKGTSKLAKTALKAAANTPWGRAVIIIVLVLLILAGIVVAIINGDNTGTCQTAATASGTPGGIVAHGEPTTAELMNLYGHNQQEVEANLVSIDFQGKQVKVHKLVAATFQKVNTEITQANTGYKFRNVGTFAWRQKNCPGGCRGLSTHSFGISMDINPDTNPYTAANIHDIPPAVVQIFKNNGFAWGGDWHGSHDWMHFQFEGDPGTYAGAVATSGASNCSGSTAGTVAAGYVAPAPINSCNGKYAGPAARNPLHMNFGDPSCSFTKDVLYTQLKQNDPQNADVWFNKVIPCESGYQPNAYAGPQTGTPDARGAWGLAQMGSSTPPGIAPDPNNKASLGKNGLANPDGTIKKVDRGDVNWEAQVTYFTQYGKTLSRLGAYWACAR